MRELKVIKEAHGPGLSEICGTGGLVLVVSVICALAVAGMDGLFAWLVAMLF